MFMLLRIKYENGEKKIELKERKKIFDILRENGFKVQDYLIKMGGEIVLEEEFIEVDGNKEISMELIKIVSGG